MSLYKSYALQKMVRFLAQPVYFLRFVTMHAFDRPILWENGAS